MKRFCLPFLLGLLLPVALPAAIPLGVLQTFDDFPTNTSWSTASIPGDNSTFSSTALFGAAITNDAAVMTNFLGTTASLMPNTSAFARWNSTGKFISTCPAGIAATLLMATITNTSGSTLHSVTVRYRLSISQSTLAGFLFEGAPLGGHAVYYSTTGDPGSWTLIPELTTSMSPPTDGTQCATLDLGFWPRWQNLYMLWVDDNGFSNPEPLLALDDFIVTPQAVPCQPPPIQPQPQQLSLPLLACQGGDNDRRLQVAATGLDLTYQWYQITPSGETRPVVNHTATNATLVFSNASPSLDSGDYFVVIHSSGGSVTSLTSHVEFFHFDLLPQLVRGQLILLGNDETAFQLTFNTPVCTDWLECGGNAMEPSIWRATDLSDGSPIELLEGYAVGGTNIVFLVELGNRSPRTYRIEYQDGFGVVAKCAGLGLTPGATVTVPATLFIRPGASNYAGVEDTELEDSNVSGGPDASHGSLARILVDSMNGTGPSQGLLQFKNLFGFRAGEIPPGSTILRATLRLSSTGGSGSGGQVFLHRMRMPWSEDTATWHSFGSGIVAGIHAEVVPDAIIHSAGLAVPFAVETDVTSSVRAWATGMPNNGWALVTPFPDGFSFDSSETANGPVLTVEFESHFDPCQPVFLNDVPSSTSVLEGAVVTLAPQVSGFIQFDFQWFKNGVALAGATNITLTVTSGDVCAGTAIYRLRATCPDGSASALSAPAAVYSFIDIVRPRLLSALGNLAGTQVTLEFSKAMNPVTTTNPANYTFTPALAVTGVVLSSNGFVATITTAPRGLVGHTLRIQGVTDTRACEGGFLIAPNPTEVQLTGLQPVLAWDSEWLYATNSQDASLLGTPWYSLGFTPGSEWKTGQALLGLETTAATVAQFPVPLRTAIPPIITTYFRRSVALPVLPPGTQLVLGHFVDDGAVFYLDGVEFARFNMGTNSPVLSSDFSATAVAGDASVKYLPLDAPPGPHLLAVEVHQSVATSADNLFGAQILVITAAPTLTITNISRPQILWNADASWELTSSTNITGPYSPAPANLTPVHDASFYKLRFRGGQR